MKKCEAALDEVEQRVRTASKVCQHCKGTGRPPGWDESKKKVRKR